MKCILFVFTCLLPLLVCGQNGKSKILFVTQNIQLKNGLRFSLQLPAGYHIAVAAETGSRLRFLLRSEDGRLFATDMHDRSDNTKGRILVFDKWNEKTHHFDTTIEFLNHLRNPNQVAFYSTGDKHFIYVAQTDVLKRYTYTLQANRPNDTGQVLAHYPDYGLNYKYGGWHLTRSLGFHNNKLYISIGSSCNACIETEQMRAVIVEMSPDGSQQNIYATGLRNAVGMKWINNQLWVTGMGRDGIGPDKPEDLFIPVVKNGFYGWPYYYQYKKKVYADTAFKEAAIKNAIKPPNVAPVGIAAHSAPLGFAMFSNFSDTLINNGFLIALHGSTSVWRQGGNTVVKVNKDGSYQEVISGFLQGKTEALRYGRPCDILQWDDHSFFITDDKNGVLYYVWK